MGGNVKSMNTPGRPVRSSQLKHAAFPALLKITIQSYCVRFRFKFDCFWDARNSTLKRISQSRMMNMIENVLGEAYCLGW